MASSDAVPHPTFQEECRISGSSNDSPTEFIKSSSNNSKDSNSSKCSSQFGSAQFTDSTEFDILVDDISITAINGSKESICGTSSDNWGDFHSNCSRTYPREGPGSFTISWIQQLQTKEWILSDKKKKTDVHTKGGKTLPKKKPQQKTTFTTDHTINVQDKNNMACHLLSARDNEIKQLKNEVAVLQNKLETVATENNMLKRLQSQHLKVIRNYENAEINLPDLLTTHSKEMQALKEHLHKSQEEERRASKKLKDVEVQLLKTKDAFQALKKVSEDKKLEERGELQRKLKLLTQKLEASDKRTQDLEKQLSLKTTSFRHQLAVEKTKTTEAQSITANLEREMESLKLKLKMKWVQQSHLDRQQLSANEENISTAF
ncbi:lebercilin-like protein [Erythrolamprus reginae]|uniref:lebercilin-like protein n=1 Tax=Erythrolamprus reginae TaxID=121349 RepID=UPI00396C3DE8